VVSEPQVQLFLVLGSVPSFGFVRFRLSMAEEGKTRIEKFDGHDFGFWKMQIEDLLYQKNLYLPLTGQRPEKMTEAE